MNNIKPRLPLVAKILKIKSSILDENRRFARQFNNVRKIARKKKNLKTKNKVAGRHQGQH